MTVLNRWRLDLHPKAISGPIGIIRGGRNMEKVPGKNKKHKVKLFTLSTCGWCKKTKELMQQLDCEYEFVDIDTVHGDEGKKIREELKKFNPSQNVPVIVIDDGKQVIIGFKEDRIKEVLEDG
jgi:glutaredoxin-like protein NrdH